MFQEPKPILRTNPTETYMQYQMSIQEKTAWICQRASRYGELQRVFVAAQNIYCSRWTWLLSNELGEK